MTTQKNEVNLPENVVKLAESIKKEIKVGDAGVVEVNKDLYEKHLPEQLTLGTVKAVQDHNSNFLAAVSLAVGEIGLAHLKKHKDIDTITANVPVAKDKLNIGLKREAQVPDGLGKGGMRTKHGVLSVGYKVHAAGNVGAYKKVREHISATAEDFWGKK